MMLAITFLFGVYSYRYIPVTLAFKILSPSRPHVTKRHHTYHTLQQQQHLASYQQKRTLFMSSTNSPAANQDWSINAIEEARQQLEHMIGPMIFTDHNTGCTDTWTMEQHTKKKPHLLTNAGRKRREIEIRLLQSLQYSDDAIDELMSLWINECPNQIVNIDILQFMSSQDSTCTIREAELILRNILQDCPLLVWTEPGARLAYILYMQEQYVECEQYVQSVLSVKPWHFEMIQLQIVLALTYHRSMSRAIHLARQYGLPPLHHRKHRSRWVQNMTQQAQERLDQLESYTESELHPSPSFCLDHHDEPPQDHPTADTTAAHNSNSNFTAFTTRSSTISSWQ